MAKKKTSRKEMLKGPDEFLSLSGRIAELVAENLRLLKIIGTALLAIVVLYIGFNAYMNLVNKKGQESLNTAFRALSRVETSKPDTEKFIEAEELFMKVVNEHGFSKAAKLALPQIAHIKYLKREYDEASGYYREFLDYVEGEPQYESLARLGLAACSEEKEDFKSAIETLEPVVNSSDEVFAEVAMFNLARLYRLDNNTEKARSVLESFIERFENSPYLPLVKAQIS
jgi:predicted negative regulator of RcsB-dependent stress response